MILKRFALTTALSIASISGFAQTVTISSASVAAGSPAVITVSFSSTATAPQVQTPTASIQIDMTLARPPIVGSGLVTGAPGTVTAGATPTCAGNATTVLTGTTLRTIVASAASPPTAIGTPATQIVCTYTIPTSPMALVGNYPFTLALTEFTNVSGVKFTGTTVNGSITITPPVVASNVNQTPATLPFGNSNIGTATATQNLVLANTNATAGSATCTISGANAADFAFFPAVAGGVVAIASGATVNVPVRFTPSGAGARVGSIACVGTTSSTVVTGAPTALTGTGVDLAPVIAYAPAPAAAVTFPAGAAGAATTSITISTTTVGTGAGTAVVSGCAIGAGFTPAGTVSTTPANGTFNVTTTAGSIDLTCTRGAAVQNASLTCNELRTPPGGAPTVRTWPLTCPVATVVVGATVAQTPATLTFAASNVGTPLPATQNVVFTNTAAAAGAVNCTITGDFAFLPAVTFPLAVGANAAVNVPVQFTPTAAGARTGSVACTAGAATTLTGSPTALSGTGTPVVVDLAPVIAYAPAPAAAVTFPAGAAGAATTSIAISTTTVGTGAGTAVVSGCAIGAGFTPAGTVSTTPANGTFNVTTTAGSIDLTCTRGAAVQNASLTCNELRTPPGGAPTVRTWPLTCPVATVVVGATVAQTPATLTFAASNVGTPLPATQNLVLANINATAGSATCTISGVNAADFAFFPAVAGGVVAIASGATVNVPVRFTPSGAGARGGSIACVGAAGTTVTGSPTALTGTGVAVDTAPTVTYTPAPGAITFPAGPAGVVNATLGIATTGAVGAGTASVTGCALGAGFTPAGTVTTTPANGVFNTTTTTGTINLSCTRGAVAQTASLTCNELRTPPGGAPTVRTWSVTCPIAVAPAAVVTASSPSGTNIPASNQIGSAATVATPAITFTNTVVGSTAGSVTCAIAAPANGWTVAPAGAQVVANGTPVVQTFSFAATAAGAQNAVATCSGTGLAAPVTYNLNGTGTAVPALVLVTQVPTLSNLSIWLLVASMLGFGLVMVGRRQN